MPKKIVLVVLLVMPLASLGKAKARPARQPASLTCNALDFGAVGDGIVKDTQAIQNAIDHCTNGTVILPAGKTFLSGTLFLKSEVSFRIEPGAVLRGSRETSDYRDLRPDTKNSQLKNCRKALLYAVNVKNIVIDGGQSLNPTVDDVNEKNSGTIDGNGIDNPNWNGSEKTRPMAIFVALSENVTIQHVQVVNAGMWSVVGLENSNMLIESVKVDSHSGPTRDGIDIVDCSNVTIQNVWVNSEDDSICLKSGSTKGVHNVTVKNSTVAGSGVANALKLGTASSGSFDGIRFVGIHIESAKQAAMAVESVDGAAIHGVTFKDIQFKNVGSAFFILLGQRKGARKIGSIKNVFFQNIAGSTNLNWGSVISGAQIAGSKFPVSNIDFQDVSIVNQSLGDLKTIPANPAEYSGDYPDPRLYGPPPLPAFGIFLRHVDGISFRASRIAKAPNDPRQEVITDDVRGLTR